MYGDELANAEKAVAGAVDTSPDASREVHARLQCHCQAFWTFDSEEDVFGWSGTEQGRSPDELAQSLAPSQPLARMYESLLEKVIECLDSASVTLRTKALKAISLIIAEDDSLFNRVR